MPNWTTNKVCVMGDDETLRRVAALLEGETEFDFGKVIPCPKELQDTVAGSWPSNHPEHARMQAVYDSNKKKHGYATWYEFCVAEWGTKWNARDVVHLGIDKGELNYEFETAWAPPTPVLRRLSELFPDVLIKSYHEEEGGLYEPFVQTFKAGELLYEKDVPDWKTL